MGENNTYNICHGGEEMPIDYTTTTCVSCFHVSMQGDYMMANIFMYAAITSKYNKVMHIIHASYPHHIGLRLVSKINSHKYIIKM